MNDASSLPATEESFWTWLDLMGGARLDELPPGIVLEDDLRLEENPRVTALPPRLTVNGFCLLRGLPNLKEVPDGLVVSDWLGVDECPSLTRVGAVKVGGDAYLALLNPDIRLSVGMECHELVLGGLGDTDGTVDVPDGFRATVSVRPHSDVIHSIESARRSAFISRAMRSTTLDYARASERRVSEQVKLINHIFSGRRISLDNGGDGQ